MFSKQKFDEYKDKYKRFLASSTSYDEGYKWEALGAFENNWNIGASDMATMVDLAFQQGEEERLWSDKNDSAKSVLVEFAKMSPDITRDIFEDLYRESSDVVLRMDRFVYHCDQMLADLQKIRPSANYHYHDDYKMISFYLALKFPELYTFYDYNNFKTLLTKLDAKTTPGLKEIDRFFKVMRVFQKFLVEDEDLVANYKKRVEDSGTTPDINLFLAYDFMSSCTNSAYQVDRY